MRAVGGFLLVLLLVLPLVGADTDDATVDYADASGSALVGLTGPGVDGVNLAAVPFVPNATHPKLQFLFDYDPTNVTVGDRPPSVSLLYEFRVDLVDNSTDETVTSLTFRQPGERYHTLDNATVDGRTFRADVVLEVGVDVDWQLRIVGWRVPVPI